MQKLVEKNNIVYLPRFPRLEIPGTQYNVINDNMCKMWEPIHPYHADFDGDELMIRDVPSQVPTQNIHNR